MSRATTQFMPPTLPDMRSPNHGMRSSVLSWPAIMTRAENHTSVSHAPFSFFTSSQVSTPESSRTERPMKPVVVAERLMALPAIHRIRMSANTKIIFFSALVTGPISESFARATTAASGVSFTSGGLSLYSTSGTTMSATRPGTRAAMHQPTQVISMPAVSAASCTASGLAAMAVTNMAEVIISPWKAHRCRNDPILFCVPSSARLPKV